jgi:4-alpha-glucanotransferase
MAAPDTLQRLARLYNLQTAYKDGLGQPRQAPPEAILSVLKSLGAPVDSLEDVSGALRQRRLALWQRGVEPITVAWHDQPFKIKLRLPQRLAQAKIAGEIDLEDGGQLAIACEDGRSQPLFKEVEGCGYVKRTVLVHTPISLGYHRLHLRLDDLELTSDLFAAPYQAYSRERRVKPWGVFCPLYALNSTRSWGAGDFSDLAELAHFIGEWDGQALATLPMLAGFLDEPFNPSPYAPVSRLFWNEFYLEVTRIPEFSACPAAQALFGSDEFRRELDAVRSHSKVEYPTVMALKRRVLERLLELFLLETSDRRQRMERFAAEHPRLHDYAAFRAKAERERTTWHHWAEAARRGVLNSGDFDERARQYHIYVQWLCHEQAHWLSDQAGQDRVALYLDFPLGVNRDGYDVWRERDLFALDASGGAPPDALFVKGQNWGFPPFQPGALRRQAYRYYRDCLRHHMADAGMLRIDHVMGLHRAFWVPDGFGAAEGLYVHARAEEFYAVLSLESHRHQVEIVGENLGTVPAYVNQALARHRILGMHVGQFGVGVDPTHALEAVPARSVASLNTHDTATFMGFWTGAEIDDRVALGLLDEEQARREHEYRSAQRDALTAFLRAIGRLDSDETPAAVLKGWLAFLAENAEFLLINLEDLWLETAPQNVPGTWLERPNWQRKASLTIEQIRAMPKLLDLLKTIRDIRSRIS